MGYKLTKAIVDALPYPDTGQMFCRDAELKGFGLRIGMGSKVYFAEGKINNKTVRVTIGHHGVFTAEQARQEAKSILGMIAKGVNPNDLKKTEKAKSVTLKQVFGAYLKTRSQLKPRTVYDYTRFMSSYFADWQNKPVYEISKDMIERRHRELGARSPAQANLAMRFIRAIFNFASGQYEDSDGNPIIQDNPTKRLSQTRAWYRVERRQTVIKPNELPAFVNSVIHLPEYSMSANSTCVRDYLLLLLFTGLRREEALSLSWANINLKDKTLTIPDPKNRRPHTLPLSSYIYSMLKQRHAENFTDSPFVFPSTGIKGYMNDPRPQMRKVIEHSEVTFTPHDLRRTFITIAESLDISAYALKRLANHKMSGDVTAGYIIDNPERLREPMQRITDYILKQSDITHAS